MEAYQERYVNEYEQLCDKYGKLLKILRKIDSNSLEFELNCPVELLKEQADVMLRYIDVLLRRAKYEGIKLTHYNFNIMYGDEYGQY